MSGLGKEKHEQVIEESVNFFKRNGFRAIIMNAKSPDAILVKDDKIFALEVTGRQYDTINGWKSKDALTKKKYEMFDEVFIVNFNRQKDIYPLVIDADLMISPGNSCIVINAIRDKGKVRHLVPYKISSERTLERILKELREAEIIRKVGYGRWKIAEEFETLKNAEIQTFLESRKQSNKKELTF